MKSDGTVVTVGNNPLDEDTRGEFEVSGWTDIVYVSAGNQTTIALKADGTMVSTGYNSRDQHATWHDLVYVTARLTASGGQPDALLATHAYHARLS